MLNNSNFKMTKDINKSFQLLIIRLINLMNKCTPKLLKNKFSQNWLNDSKCYEKYSSFAIDNSLPFDFLNKNKYSQLKCLNNCYWCTEKKYLDLDLDDISDEFYYYTSIHLFKRHFSKWIKFLDDYSILPCKCIEVLIPFKEVQKIHCIKHYDKTYVDQDMIDAYIQSFYHNDLYLEPMIDCTQECDCMTLTFLIDEKNIYRPYNTYHCQKENIKKLMNKDLYCYKHLHIYHQNFFLQLLINT